MTRTATRANRPIAKRINPRALAAKVVATVVGHSRYLDTALEETLLALPPAQQREAALIQEMAYGVLRWFHQLEFIAGLLIAKALKDKDRDVQALLLVGLYQLRHMRVAKHAAVTETVSAAAALKKTWAKNFINACLRTYLREETDIQAKIAPNESAAFSHPAWMLDEIRSHWPEDWEKILRANNERPPMVLRVNRLKRTRAQYLAHLASCGITAQPLADGETAVLLPNPMPVSELPGFSQGEVSVQDAAAQFAAVLLDAKAGERVLDACAAPGGKTGHLREHTPELAELVALDREPARVVLIDENLSRLRLPATVLTGDAGEPSEWWDGRPFDRILVDVPCSAMGVIRRHPDIKVRRRPEDLPRLVAAQARILEGLWPLLKPGGKLLYVTCSILPAENEDQVAVFLRRHPEAVAVSLPMNSGRARVIGRQILPGESEMDGFYYACLSKR